MYNLTQVKALQTTASALAIRMAKEDQLTEIITSGVDAKIDAQRSSFGIHLYLRNLFTAEEIDAFPVVGSKEKDEAGTANNNPDIVEYTDLNGNKKSVSFWKSVASTHPLGKAWLDRIAALNDAEKVKNEFSGWSKHDRDDERKTCQNKFTTFFGNLRQAVALFDAIRLGNEVKGVKVELAMVQSRTDDGKPAFDKDGKKVMEPTPSVQCIKVSDSEDPSVARYFTVANFLRLRPAEANLAGGGFVNYTTSNKRGTGDDESEDSGIKIEKIGEFEDATIAMVNFVNVVRGQKNGLANFIKHYIEKGADDRLLTLSNLQDALSIVLDAKPVKDRLDALRLGTVEKAA